MALEGPPVPRTAAVTGRRGMLLEQVLICTVTKAARGHELRMTRSVPRSSHPSSAACPWGEMAGIPPVCTSDSPCTEIPAAPATGNLDLLTPSGKVRNEVSATFLSLRNFFPSRAIKAGVRHPGGAAGVEGVVSIQRTLFSGPGCISDRLILLLLFFPQLVRGDSSIPPGRPRDTRCHRSNMTHGSPTEFWLAACPHLVLEKSSSHIS